MEGNGISQLTQVIRRVGRNDFDRFELATVTSAAPALRIKPDDCKIDIPMSNLVVAESLTDYTVTVRHTDGTEETLTIKRALNVGDRVILASASHGQTYYVIDRMATK